MVAEHFFVLIVKNWNYNYFLLSFSKFFIKNLLYVVMKKTEISRRKKEERISREREREREQILTKIVLSFY